jgi:dihydroorotate dehydrogenase (fumarate)
VTVDLTTTYLGMSLSSPLVPSASPMTGNLDGLLALEEAGAGAVVLPSLFEEQIVHDALAIADATDIGAGISPEFFGSQLPEMDDYNTGSEAYLQTLVTSKRELGIPVIGSLNGNSPGGWVSYGRKIEDSGADALELNVYHVATDPDVPGSTIEDGYLRLVEDVRARISIPLAVKVAPFFSSMADMARRLVDAGADGLVLFNRFYQPDIDLEALDVRPNLVLSTSEELRLPLTWIGVLHGRIDTSLAATSGVHTAEDVVKLVLAGADVTMMASALLRHGASHLRGVHADVVAWFDERGYESVEQAKGSLSQRSSPDPAAFERANYMRALTTYVTSPR